jgi:hypothetical protein
VTHFPRSSDMSEEADNLDDDEEEVEHYTDRIAFWWTCGSCGDIQESEYDQRGQQVTCEMCGVKGKLLGDY